MIGLPCRRVTGPAIGRPPSSGQSPGRNPYGPGPTPLLHAARTRPRGCVTTASAIDAEGVAALCLLVADGDLAISCADLADLLDATERRARASFGPVPGALRRALVGLAFDAALVSPEDLREQGLDAAFARIALRDLLPPMLSRDQLRFDARGGHHWTAAAPASLASPGSLPRARALLSLVASRAPPPAVLAALERLGVDRSFIRTLLEPGAPSDDEEARDLVSYQDWFE